MVVPQDHFQEALKLGPTTFKNSPALLFPIVLLSYEISLLQILQIFTPWEYRNQDFDFIWLVYEFGFQKTHFFSDFEIFKIILIWKLFKSFFKT